MLTYTVDTNISASTHSTTATSRECSSSPQNSHGGDWKYFMAFPGSIPPCQPNPDQASNRLRVLPCLRREKELWCQCKGFYCSSATRVPCTSKNKVFQTKPYIFQASLLQDFGCYKMARYVYIGLHIR